MTIDIISTGFANRGNLKVNHRTNKEYIVVAMKAAGIASMMPKISITFYEQFLVTGS